MAPGTGVIVAGRSEIKPAQCCSKLVFYLTYEWECLARCGGLLGTCETTARSARLFYNCMQGENFKIWSTVGWESAMFKLLHDGFHVYGPVHRWSILIIVQRDATRSSLFIILQAHSTCSGCQPHPSWVHKTVTTASGTGHAVLCS